MRHLPSGRKEQIDMDCEQLLVHFLPDASKKDQADAPTKKDPTQQKPDGGADGPMHVRSVEAVSDIHIVQKRDGSTREIDAHRLVYNASTDQAILRGEPGKPVRIVDRAKPQPLRAAEIRWNLKKDLFEVLRAEFR